MGLRFIGAIVLIAVILIGVQAIWRWSQEKRNDR